MPNYSVYDRFVTSTSSGQTLPNATVTVTRTDGGGLATLYQTRTGTPESNPFTCDANGRATFYIEEGRYNINATLGAESVTYNDVLIQSDTIADGNYDGKATIRQRLDNLDVETISDLRALPTAQITVGDSVRVTSDTGKNGIFYSRSGAVTDNEGTLIVATDDANRYYERKIEDDTIITSWFVKSADAGNGGKAVQRAIYAAQAQSVSTVKMPIGTIQIGDAVNPTAIYVPKNVNLIGSGFGTILSKQTFGSSSGWHVISGRPDTTENYYDPLGNQLTGTGDPLEARNHTIGHFEVQFGIGVWFVKAREATAEYINAGNAALTACVFGNDATEDCANIAINNISRNVSQTANAWFTIGLFRTNVFSINGFTQKAQSNAAAIKIDTCSDGVLGNISIDQQSSLYNGVDILDGDNIVVSKSCTFKNCLSSVVSFSNTAPYDANCTFSHTSIGGVNHVRLYTRKNTVVGSVNINCTNDVRLETDALLNTFIANDFRAKTLHDSFSLVNLQDWVSNLGLQEGVRANLSTVDQIIRNSTNANISLTTAGEVRVGAGTGQSLFLGANGDQLTLGVGSTVIRPGVDNAMDLGLAGNRWREVFAVNGTINTSDETEKQDFSEIPQYIKDAALEIKSTLGMWRWIHAFNEKGDSARWHIGPVAQRVHDIIQQHIIASGANDSPFNYGLLTRDEWESPEGEIIERWGIRPTELLYLIISSI